MVTVLPDCGDFQMKRQHSATIAHRALPACEYPALDILWGTVSQMQPLQYAAGVAEPALGAFTGLARWFVDVVVD